MERTEMTGWQRTGNQEGGGPGRLPKEGGVTQSMKGDPAVKKKRGGV